MGGTVHGHMETALQCAALTAITMQENSTVTWEWMIMIAGLVTSALQKNAQQEHTEDKIVALRETKLYISTKSFKIRIFFPSFLFFYLFCTNIKFLYTFC